jgi:UDP-glucuronate decarboxylase
MIKITLVTGGAGFVGSNLVRKLVKNDPKLILVVIDNLITTGTPKYIADLISGNKVGFINCDITNWSQLNSQLNKLFNKIMDSYPGEIIKVNRIYNLASPASVKLYSANPEFTFMTSVLGITNMIRVTKEYGTDDCKLLETSTSEIYGDPLEIPQSESYFGNVNTQSPRACYDEGKRGAETLCYIANHQSDTPFCHIARLFNVYGPNCTDDRVIPTFVHQALTGAPITVYGDGNQFRCFCYVDDVVDGLIKLMESDVYTPVNLGNGSDSAMHTINELAETIKFYLGSKSEIVHLAPLEGEPQRRRPDTIKAMDRLSWAPVTEFRDGIAKTVDWIRYNFKY